MSIRPLVSIALASLLACSGELIAVDPGAEDDDPDAGSTASSRFFRPDVQSDLDSAGCATAVCHGGEDVPMPLVPRPAAEDDWLANYNQVSARAGSLSASLLIDKATGAGGHVAGITPDDPMLERWRDWIAGGNAYQEVEDAADAGPTGASDAGPEGADASGGDPQALTWDDDIAPIMNARCTSCHGTSGAYSLETYGAARGFGTDGVPNVIAGDASSLLAVYCQQGHEEIPLDDALIVVRWIVDWDARER